MVHVLLKPGLENFEHYFSSGKMRCSGDSGGDCCMMYLTSLECTLKRGLDGKFLVMYILQQ